MFLIFWFVVLIPIADGLFFGGGGCGCRPQQCSCPAPVCPPPPCGARPFVPPPFYPQYRAPPPPPPQPYYQVAQQSIPYQTFQGPYVSSYQPPPPQILTSSYNAPYTSSINTAPIQVASAKETSETIPDTVIQKSKTLTAETNNELDEDIKALSNFESSIQAYKSLNVVRNEIRRAHGTKTEKPEKCTSPRLQKIMEKAMSSNVAIPKLKISKLAKREFGYNFDVICSQFDFSYLISSSISCRVEMDGQTCLAYQN
uniref:Ground-like domain-containing protein n=1 Tax=Caenorhabditis japonica TaxID=281687 RepID=A0A8R1DP47_CAEJA